MRPLARVHAVTDASVAALPDLGVRAAALASVGPAVALAARLRGGTGAAHAALARRLGSLARPAEASLVVSARPDIARALHADALQLGEGDLPPGRARPLVPGVRIGCSVHSVEEGRAAAGEGADYLVAGTIWPSPSHADRPAAGPALLEALAPLGLPILAIGGVTPGRAREAREAGAWGVAAVRALWLSADPAETALACLEPWGEDA